ncbi:gluconokinase [Roseisalinus antarcticus]|uniref:Gluconokinase n=1 Tax=Roseisalinus antarcticus TaxID=254357 RepID=A0A1Y5RN44_9RHOB|nr:gluconokinase [Roseisalinus antarcticus]SLN18786.1 Thermoresistant gluconokinase [Roseisalinus antarcticus]
MSDGRYVVMGVSGCGKSLIGAMLAARLGAIFHDGDDLHPPANVAKMARGTPLTDADRAPWLDEVGRVLRVPNIVVACSALRRIYRARITEAAGAPVTFLYLRGTRATLQARVSNRPGHFMPAALLDSQLATLEEPGPEERAVTADIEQPPDAVVAALIAGLQAEGAPS